ncbi:ABC transporter substrate-binding protein [Haloarcula nitratireducens]|uniref:ABC transporter substrate-binding protein n=1 Tax=Haloarcula nitratireducens TaxID=2487749 RepID=UPI001F1D8D91|nr:ABC transporter substrate-binding protein [Halomicroarcula nitratireducens]
MGRRQASGGKPLSRRRFIQAAGVSGVAGLAGCGGGGGGGTPTAERIGNYPVTGETVAFGFNVARSGPFSTTGEEELRGHRLAVKHINEGGGWVDTQYSGQLSGDGLLGKTVEPVVGDTESDPDAARASATSMIENDEIIMLSGGSTSDTGLAHQRLAAEKEVIFMATMTHIDTLTGASCNRFTFRELFNGYMTAKALKPVLVDEYGEDVDFFQIYSRDDWGSAQRDLMKQSLTDAGWTPVGTLSAQLGTRDFSQYVPDLENASEDVLILNLRGLDAANAVRAVRKAFPEENIVIPLYTRAVAQTAGGAIEDVIGTIEWDPSIETPLSEEFRSAFSSEYSGGTGSASSSIPSGPAHVAYTQTLQYAYAAQKAGTFDPNEVISALEGLEYGAGIGSETLRACDHQSMRPVPVVRGRPGDRQAFGRYYNLINTTRDAMYPCSEGPAAECSLGGN